MRSGFSPRAATAQLALDTAYDDELQARYRDILLAVTIPGLLLSALLGQWMARRAIAPVTAAATRIGAIDVVLVEAALALARLHRAVAPVHEVVAEEAPNGRDDPRVEGHVVDGRELGLPEQVALDEQIGVAEAILLDGLGGERARAHIAAMMLEPADILPILRQYFDAPSQKVIDTALAIANEEEDGRIYVDIGEGLRGDYPASSAMFFEMANEEAEHRRLLLDLYRTKYGEHIPLVRRQDVRGFIHHKPVWQMQPLNLDAVRAVAEAMEAGWQGDHVGAMHCAPLASTYFNMRKTTIYGGSNEVQRNIVAQTVLG